MGFYGMDPEQALGEADALEQAARRLEEVLGTLQAGVHGTAWEGPDAEVFRADWDAARREGEGTVVPGLEDRSRALRQHAEEQERVSSLGDDGGWFEDAMAWLRETGDGIVDGIRDGIGWVGDRLSEGTDRISGLLSEGKDWLSDRAADVRDAVGTAIDAVRDHEWPRLTELLVDGLSGAVRRGGDLWELLTGQDLHLADDGTGYADAPVAVTPEGSGLVPPQDISQIIANVNRTYGDASTGEVSMTVVGSPPTGVIVNIPGTEQWLPTAGDNPMDLTGNAAQAGADGWSAGAEATADAIRQLFEDRGIPLDTPLMLAGHSQGGMIASSLAQDDAFASRYHLTNVLTYGSPVDNYDIPRDVDQLNIQHRGDLVPRIDLGGFPVGGSDHTTTITLDSPSPNPFAVGTAHSGAEYQNSVETALQDPSSPLSQYSSDPSLLPFLSADPEAIQHYLAGVHRRR